MDIASIMKLVFLLLIIVVLVILFVVLGLQGKKKKITEEIEDEEDFQEQDILTPSEPLIDPENCEAPLKQVFHPFNTLPKPMDPSGSECMELNEQENIVNDMLDWGPDDYPNPSYEHDKMC